MGACPKTMSLSENALYPGQPRPMSLSENLLYICSSRSTSLSENCYYICRRVLPAVIELKPDVGFESLTPQSEDWVYNNVVMWS